MQELDTKPIDLIEYFSSKGYNAISVDGYRVINSYTSKVAEIESLYSGVGLRNISHYGIIELKGKDVLEFLHRISTNATKDLLKAHTNITVFTSDKGRIIGVGRLINFEDYQLLVCSRSNKQKVISWIRKYVIGDDVDVNDVNGKYNLLELSGPQADSFMSLICGDVINSIEKDSFKIMYSDNLLFFLIKLVDERGHIKFWLLADVENSKKLIDKMVEYDGPFDFNLIGEEAYNIFRVEQGIPAAPDELNDNYNPHEARLMKYVDTEKGCYIGQEVVERLSTYNKVQKYLCGVNFSEEFSSDKPFHLFSSDGNEAGIVTSTVHSVKLDRQIGLAYIRKAYMEEGTILKVDSSDGNEIDVTVCNLPFVR
ncbi:MAG: glycine cleavage T C-terminal barrel domain-containing protein [Ignavibacteriaceae bacterium]